MARTRRIVGVVGGSGGMPGEVIRLAEEVGRAVAAAGAIVLTGGLGDHAAMTVKDAAARGASAGPRISIVKGGRGIVTGGGSIVVHSGMRDARNVLNAFASDALIALRGGGGTLSEVAFAAIAGRPVIFLQSRRHLAERIGGMGDIAKQAVETFGDSRFSEENLVRAAAALLEDPAADADSIEEAVRRALSAPVAGTLLPIPGQPGAVGEYERALARLE